MDVWIDRWKECCRSFLVSTPPSTLENSPAPLSAEQPQSISGEKGRSAFTGERASDGLETDSALVICLILDAGCVLSVVLAHALGEIFL